MSLTTAIYMPRYRVRDAERVHSGIVAMIRTKVLDPPRYASCVGFKTSFGQPWDRTELMSGFVLAKPFPIEIQRKL